MSITATTTSKGRVYHTPDGDFPSVTTILGQTANNIWLQKWKEKVGEEEAARISKYATDRGEKVHSYLERFWNGEDINNELVNDFEYDDIQNMTTNLIKATSNNITKSYEQEIAVWHKELGYAGRVDMVGQWRGEDAIIDFKTSKKKKYISNVKDFFFTSCCVC